MLSYNHKKEKKKILNFYLERYQQIEYAYWQRSDVTVFFFRHQTEQGGLLLPSSQNATALAAATFRESTPWDIGILIV